MITARELYDATMRGEGLLYKHARDNPDMPVFLLIAQDCLAAALVEKWTIQLASMLPTCDSKRMMDKLQEARMIAELMDKWPVRKVPGSSFGVTQD